MAKKVASAAPTAPVPEPAGPSPLPPLMTPRDPVALRSPEERATAGKLARKKAPRSAHAAWSPAPQRPDPVALLQSEDGERIADLLPIRYGRMLSSPFAFYRGAAAIMASDLAGTPVSGVRAQLCGDAHLSNFGIFRTPERSEIFDINDFDETSPGPWEFDLKRLAASFEIALRERDASARDRRTVVLASVSAYREAMAQFAEMRNLDVWYSRADLTTISAALSRLSSGKVAQQLTARVSKAAGKDSLRALTKLTETVDGQLRIRHDPPLLVPADDLLQGPERERFKGVMEDFLKSYHASLSDDRRRLVESYHFVQIARKVVGVGSVGTRAWIVFLLGRDDGDPLFLQMKQATAPALAPYVGSGRYRHQGRRVVEGQRLMQAASDPMLGWYSIRGFDGRPYQFYVRQLWDGKASVDPAVMPLPAWEPYARLCGWTLARAHARSGDRIAIAAYLGVSDVFDRAVAEFASTYAQQNQRDFEALQEAAASGRIAAEKGV
jgi:uncharacterized protein (DUF2252 family)